MTDTDIGDATADAAKPRFWSVPDWSGESYIGVLRRFHETFKPKSYLEIGVDRGATLGLAACDTIAVDPSFRLEADVVNNKPRCLFHKMTSDDFFQAHDPTALLGRAIDMAFLDGFHWFEFLLRDFINAEKHCKPNSIIFMHDCLPTDAYVARREMLDSRLRKESSRPTFWAGDVWKAAAIIRKYRPDLRITTFDARPTGLVAITRLDPKSRLLSDRYGELVDAFTGKDLHDERERYFAEMNIVEVDRYRTQESLSTLFWL